MKEGRGFQREGELGDREPGPRWSRRRQWRELRSAPWTKAIRVTGFLRLVSERSRLEEERAAGGRALEPRDGGWEGKLAGALPHWGPRVLQEAGGGEEGHCVRK